MATNGSRIPKVRKIDANAGAWKVASALNTVSKVLRIADLKLKNVSPIEEYNKYHINF